MFAAAEQELHHNISCFKELNRLFKEDQDFASVSDNGYSKDHVSREAKSG
jgi:hypothetical protein